MKLFNFGQKRAQSQIKMSSKKPKIPNATTSSRPKRKGKKMK